MTPQKGTHGGSTEQPALFPAQNSQELEESLGASERMNFLIEGGQVVRFHTKRMISRQTVAEHSFNVSIFVLLLTKGFPSRNLLINATLHDVAEQDVGDIPSPVKRLISESVDLNGLERNVLEQRGVRIPPLNAEDSRTLDMADMLDGLLTSGTEVSLGNRALKPVFEKFLEYLEERKPHGIERELVDAICAQVGFTPSPEEVSGVGL